MIQLFTNTKVWEELVTIPTYGVGKPDKNPMFLEKRVYQGSSGKVYPHPVIDKIEDEKISQAYKAVFLENDFIRVMLLPQLGGRIQRATDKTNGYEFVYYNHVIKPALVGLAGPWISGGIEFNNSRLTNYIGTVALAFILFSGGLGTRWQQVRPILARGSLLSTLGVLLTAVFMYFFSYYILRQSFEISLLLSVIISSTDAPAVFSILRSHNLSVPGRLKAILEFESGSNDPMAVFMSMGAMAVISSGEWNLGSLTGDFLLQMFLGTALGMLSGYLASKTLRRWMFSYQGLYPVFGVALVLLTYSLTQMLGGNGFLAVYLCGIIMGNTGYMYRRHFIRFQESLVWIMQISMFLILGLLVFPHELSTVMPVSLACTLFLILVARPLAVFICLYRSGFSLPVAFIQQASIEPPLDTISVTLPCFSSWSTTNFVTPQ